MKLMNFARALGRGLLLIGCAAGLVACAAPAAPPRSGKRLQLQTITHEWQTTYAYRAVDDPAPAVKPR
jgi:hypothetical protein